MAPNFRLISTAPGQARIDITGLAIPAKDKGLEIAFQRASDELYIGSGGSWQSDPGWHRLGRIADPATTAFLLGSGVVDALAEVSHADSFRASARWRDGQGEGVLRIAGELIGSAGLKREPAPELPKGDDGGRPSPKRTLWPIPPAPPGPPDASLKTRATLRWALPVGGAFVALAVAGALWLGSGPSDPQQQAARQDSAAAAQQPGTDQSGTAEKPETALFPRPRSDWTIATATGRSLRGDTRRWAAPGRGISGGAEDPSRPPNRHRIGTGDPTWPAHRPGAEHAHPVAACGGLIGAESGR